MLKVFEGVVLEILDENTIHIAVHSVPHFFLNQHPCHRSETKRVKFPGTEEWLGGKRSLAALLGSKINLYGWEDPGGIVEAIAIARVKKI